MLSQITEDVYLIPRVLSDVQIGELLNIRKLNCHHNDEHGGHGGDWDDDYYREQEEWRERELKDKKKKEDDDKKNSPNKKTFHSRPDKPHILPWLSDILWPHVSGAYYGSLNPYKVDENIKIYKLQVGNNVSGHVDEDFDGPDGSRALYSILLYLNKDYLGGETIFNSSIKVKDVPLGGGLLFRHSIFHEGLAVVSGERYVLKTDLFFKL